MKQFSRKALPVILLLILRCFSIPAQDILIDPTDSIWISGEGWDEKIITIADFSNFKTIPLNEFSILDHNGIVVRKIRGAEGFLLKDLLSEFQLETDSPKNLSAIVFTCIATDQYCVRYSWNELYNTEIGNQVYVLTKLNNLPISGQKERILMVSLLDFKTGRRFLQGLQKIVIDLY